MDKANMNSYKFVLSINCILTFTHVSVCVSWHGLLFLCTMSALNAIYFYKWPSDMHIIGFHISEIKVWVIS